ncbi:MAG: tetratricopeptide repeat protein [Puniceicoccales bacterium]|jgi:tetratricopeptide (TPR) repeat protein|nr:tetratricopeptide repeat protein [Puniceicoccales bacterium]
MKKNKEPKIPKEYLESMKEAALLIVSGKFKMKDYYGLTDEGLESIYAVGHELFSHKRYDDAKGVFSLLTILSPDSVKYTSACGSTCFMAKDYKNALQYFTNALSSGDYSPKSLMRTAECSLRLGLLEITEGYLQEIIDLSKKKEFKDLKDTQICSARAALILPMVKKQIEDKKREEVTKKAVEQNSTESTNSAENVSTSENVNPVGNENSAELEIKIGKDAEAARIADVEEVAEDS